MIYDFYIVTLCNTDLECQELIISNKDDAENTADRLRFFLPRSLIHSIILEGITLVVLSVDNDGCEEVNEERTELKVL